MYIPPKLGALPAIEADECLSSYLLRVAHRHGVLPHTLCQHVWPQYAVWTRDIDRCANPGLIQAIVARTGLSSESVESMTLRPLMAAMTGEIRRHGISRWVVPLGVYHRIRHDFGQRYCSVCLRQSPRFARRAWRLAYVSACATHGCQLEDACLSCDHPFIPHRHDSLIAATCHHCGADLSTARLRTPTHDAIGFQMHSQRVLDSGIAPVDHFHGWHEWITVLARLDDRFSHVPGNWLLWRQEERVQLLGYAFSFFDAWPDSFVRWAAERRISRALLNDFSCKSQWFNQAVRLLPERFQPVRRRRKKSAQLAIKKFRSSGVQAKMEKATLLLNVTYRRMRLRQSKGSAA